LRLWGLLLLGKATSPANYLTAECLAGGSMAAARELPNIQTPSPATTMKVMSAIDATAK
jgi:hypothetical protein